LESVIDIRLSNDPRYWIERAEKARDAAEGMTDPVLKKMMLDVADGYERLAQRAEKRARKKAG
jgi:hypothetical protein